MPHPHHSGRDSLSPGLWWACSVTPACAVGPWPCSGRSGQTGAGGSGQDRPVCPLPCAWGPCLRAPRCPVGLAVGDRSGTVFPAPDGSGRPWWNAPQACAASPGSGQLWGLPPAPGREGRAPRGLWAVCGASLGHRWSWGVPTAQQPQPTRPPPPRAAAHCACAHTCVLSVHTGVHAHVHGHVWVHVCASHVCTRMSVSACVRALVCVCTCAQMPAVQ